MRGTDETSGALFGHVDLEERIPPPHPQHKIPQVVNDVLPTSMPRWNAFMWTSAGPPPRPEG